MHLAVLTSGSNGTDKTTTCADEQMLLHVKHSQMTTTSQSNMELRLRWQGPFEDMYLIGYCSPAVREATLKAAKAKVEATAGCNGITYDPLQDKESRYTGRVGTTLRPSSSTYQVEHPGHHEFSWVFSRNAIFAQHRCRVSPPKAAFSNQISVAQNDSAQTPFPEMGLISSNGCFAAVLHQMDENYEIQIMGRDYRSGSHVLHRLWNHQSQPQAGQGFFLKGNVGVIFRRTYIHDIFPPSDLIATPDLHAKEAWKDAESLRLVMQNDADLVLYATKSSTDFLYATNVYYPEYSERTCMERPHHIGDSIRTLADSISNTTFPPQGLMSSNGCFVARQDPTNCGLQVYNTQTNATVFKFDCMVADNPMEPWEKIPGCTTPCAARLHNDGIFEVSGFSLWTGKDGDQPLGPFPGKASFGKSSTRRHPSEGLWSSDTSIALTLQRDGNLVINRVSSEQSPLWSSDTWRLQDDWLYEVGTEVHLPQALLPRIEDGSSKEKASVRDSLHKSGPTTEKSMLFQGQTLMDATGSFLLTISHLCELSLLANRWMPLLHVGATVPFKYHDCYLQFQLDGNLVMYGHYTDAKTSDQRKVPLWSHKFVSPDISMVKLLPDGSLAGITDSGEVKEEAISKHRHCTFRKEAGIFKRMCYGAGKMCDPCASSSQAGLRFSSKPHGVMLLQGKVVAEEAIAIALADELAIPGLGEGLIAVEAAVALGWLIWHALGSSAHDAFADFIDEWFSKYLRYLPDRSTNQCFYTTLQRISPADAAALGVAFNTPSLLHSVLDQWLPLDVVEGISSSMHYTVQLEDGLSEAELLQIEFDRFIYRNGLDPRVAAVCWALFGGAYPIFNGSPDEADMEFAEELQRDMKKLPCRARVMDYLKSLCWEQLERIPLSRQKTTTTTTSWTRQLKCDPIFDVEPRGVARVQSETMVANRSAEGLDEKDGLPRLGVIGGTPVKGQSKFIAQYVVQIRWPRGGNTFCSGTLIGGGWVLTAAHCLLPGFNEGGEGCRRVGGEHANTVRCPMPEVGLPYYPPYAPEYPVLPVTRFFALEGYKNDNAAKKFEGRTDIVWESEPNQPVGPGVANWLPLEVVDKIFGALAGGDIALLQFAWTQQLMEETKVVMLLDATFDPFFDQMIIMGFGRTNDPTQDALVEDGTAMSARKFISRPCIAGFDSTKVDKAFWGDHPAALCSAAFSGEARTAPGDSGGPAFCSTSKPSNAEDKAAMKELNERLGGLGIPDPEGVEKLTQFAVVKSGKRRHGPKVIHDKVELFMIFGGVSFYQYFTCMICQELFDFKTWGTDRCWGCWYRPTGSFP